MGTQQGTDLNSDTPGLVPTTGYYADPGVGTDVWHHYMIAVGLHAEDEAHTSGDKGFPALAVRRDTAAASSGTDGDYEPLQTDANGALRTVTELTDIAQTEDTAHTTADQGIMGLAVRRDTAAASSGTDGDYEPLQTDATGRLRVTTTRDADDALSVATNGLTAADSLVVKASAGTLHSIAGTVLAGSDGYLIVWDLTSKPADTTTAGAELVYPIAAATDDVPFNIPLPGHVCTTGIVVTFSTDDTQQNDAAGNVLLCTGYYE